jgi:hypothetical protein
MRLLKPHSLSYQLDTFTSVPPLTLVSAASTIELAGWWFLAMALDWVLSLFE